MMHYLDNYRYTCIQLYIDVCIHTYTYKLYRSMYIYRYIHIHTYIHTYKYMCINIRFDPCGPREEAGTKPEVQQPCMFVYLYIYIYI